MISHNALCPFHCFSWHSLLQYHWFLHLEHLCVATLPQFAHLGSSMNCSNTSELYNFINRSMSSLVDLSSFVKNLLIWYSAISFQLRSFIIFILNSGIYCTMKLFLLATALSYTIDSSSSDLNRLVSIGSWSKTTSFMYFLNLKRLAFLKLVTSYFLLVSWLKNML